MTTKSKNPDRPACGNSSQASQHLSDDLQPGLSGPSRLSADTAELPSISAMETALRYMRTTAEINAKNRHTVSGAGEGAEIYDDAAKCIAFAMALKRLDEAARAVARPSAESEPVAWRYELAHSIGQDDSGKPTYGAFRWCLTEQKPSVPEGSIRNLTPLYSALPQTTPNLSHADLCALSRVWNEKHSQPHGIDYRINEWLKAQIASASTRPDRGGE